MVLSLLIENLLNEDAFDGPASLQYIHDHSELPVFAVGLYLVFIFQVPQYLSKPLNLKPLNAAWDLLLALFSIAGAYRCVPVLLSTLWSKGFNYTLCTDPFEWYGTGASGLWVLLFMYSKFPELLDTVFLVLQKKKVIFLHWFHHITVLLYCWHAVHNRIPAGIWFAAMNFTVHSVMYSYYFLMAIGLRHVAKPFAPMVTTMQLLQMVVGMVVTVSAAYRNYESADSCPVDSANLKLGLAMYFSYFVLFAVLFHNLYIKPSTHKIQTGCPDLASSLNVSDASGFFHDNSKPEKPQEKKKN